ncbi:MAG: alpha/beta hydrolase [Rhodospirillales bacterium]|nr:alpha/beta hydrolase [Rhodospirillales bacterium]
MFARFETRILRTRETVIHARIGGSGPPLLMLHGYPQTHVIWHKIADRLAERFTVVATDLRGYGDSGKPVSDSSHAAYAKRAMAMDQVEVMTCLGFQRFAVVGHDRGARVAHRMALDHSDAVMRLAVLDIVPTRTVFATVNQAVATGYYHWFFLIQPNGLPERLIGADPEYFLREKLQRWCGPDKAAITPEAFAEYLRCFNDPDMIHASCEDYRAAATIDLEHDDADRERKITCPLLVLWGEQGLVGRSYDVLAAWKECAVDVRGHGFACGHYLPEECPEETLAALRTFFG